jgi:hypothetical protein
MAKMEKFICIKAKCLMILQLPMSGNTVKPKDLHRIGLPMMLKPIMHGV